MTRGNACFGVPRLRQCAAMRSALLALVVFSSACATRLHTAPADTRTWLDVPSSGASVDAAAPAMRPVALAAPALIGDKGYTKFSLGTFTPAGDIEDLDTGPYVQIAFGGDVIPFVSLEASVGYFQVDGPSNAELMGIPLLINGRVQVPIAIVKAYGGLGVGGLFADYEVGPLDDSEFVLAGNAFLGLEIGVGNLAVGAEYRYLVTEETDPGFEIEGHAGLICLTLPF